MATMLNFASASGLMAIASETVGFKHLKFGM
jgi:hypothetical protein